MRRKIFFFEDDLYLVPAAALSVVEDDGCGLGDRVAAVAGVVAGVPAAAAGHAAAARVGGEGVHAHVARLEGRDVTYFCT